jgi:signal transduction histidine kinase
LIVFAAFSLTAIDTTLKSALDARLSAVARAFASTMPARGGRIVLNHATKQRLLRTLGVQQNGAIVLNNGSIAMQSAAVPASVRRVSEVSNSRNLSFSTVGGNSSPLRVVTLPLLSGGSRVATVALWRPVDFVSDYERGAEEVFAVAMIVLISVATLIAGLLAKRALAPIRSMASLASEIEASDLSRRLGDTPRAAELSDFCATFDRMLDRLKAAFDRQRQFTADASHDLRAPLSIIRAEADLALREPLESTACATLLSIRAEVDELDSLIDSMLHVARLETQPIASARFDLSEVSRAAIKRMVKFAAARSVHISSIITPQYAFGNGDLLERIIASLLHNAIKFTPANGHVELMLAAAGADAELSVRDDGPGFTDKALRHAFDRFWREDAARCRGGSGLGLAIAQAAVQRFRGEIRLENLASGGAQVTVRLPTVAQTRSTRDAIK